MATSSPEVKFRKLLQIIADMTKFNLTKEILALYDTHLKPFGYDRAAVALMKIYADIEPGRSNFPSVNAIKTAMGCYVSGKEIDTLSHDEATELATKVIMSLGTCRDMDQAKNHFGDFGEEICNSFGGWYRLKESATMQNMTTLHAQIRDQAKARIRKRLKDGLPAIPSEVNKVIELESAKKELNG